MHHHLLLAAAVTLVIAGCEGVEQDDCEPGDSQPCVCGGDQPMGEQECTDGSWQQCLCGECARDTDCEERWQVCLLTECVDKPCTTTDECPAGTECRNGGCTGLEQICEPGEVVGCYCASSAGLKVCQEDGGHWGDCICAGDADSDTDTDTDTDTDSDPGDFAWFRYWGTTGDEGFESVMVDSTGSIYTTGATGDDAIAIAKWSPQGFLQWDAIWDSGLIDECGFGAVHADGTVSVTGRSGLGINHGIYQDGSDGFVVRYSSSGAPLWSRVFGSEEVDDGGSAVAVDLGGSTYVTGSSWGSLAGETHHGLSDAILIKYSPDGDLLWTRQFGTAEEDWGTAIALGSDGEIYLAGNTRGELEGQGMSGVEDIFLMKLTPAGAPLWTLQWGSQIAASPTSIRLTDDGDVLVLGFTEDAFPGHTSQGFSDVFLARISPDSERQWLTQWGSAAREGGKSSVGILSDGRIVVIGTTQGQIQGAVNRGQEDVFLTLLTGGGAVLWTRQWGSSKADSGRAVAVGSEDSVYIAGTAYGTLGGAPKPGGWDAFIFKLGEIGK